MTFAQLLKETRLFFPNYTKAQLERALDYRGQDVKGRKAKRKSNPGSPAKMVKNPRSLKVHPGKQVEGLQRAQKIADKTGQPVSLLQPFFKQAYKRGGRTKMVWTTYYTVYPSKASNPGSRIGTRLTPVRFSIKGRTMTGKAKLVGGKVKIFVTPEVARKVNPELKKFLVIFAPTRKAELKPGWSLSHQNYHTEVFATTARGASLVARKKKATVVPGNPRDWHVLSVRRIS
jgi:hypothetical protein